MLNQEEVEDAFAGIEIRRPEHVDQLTVKIEKSMGKWESIEPYVARLMVNLYAGAPSKDKAELLYSKDPFRSGSTGVLKYALISPPVKDNEAKPDVPKLFGQHKIHTHVNIHTPPSQPVMPPMPNLDAKCPANAGEAALPTPASTMPSQKASDQEVERSANVEEALPCLQRNALPTSGNSGKVPTRTVQHPALPYGRRSSIGCDVADVPNRIPTRPRRPGVKPKPMKP